MNNSISFRPLGEELFETFAKIGIKAYNENYHHLWPKGDSTPYIASSYANKVFLEELANTNIEPYVIYSKNTPVGVLKLTKNSAIGHYSAKEALLIDKIYLLNQFKGKGLGRQILHFVEDCALTLDKKVIWLDVMKKSPALNFYLKNGFKVFSESEVPFPEVLAEERAMCIMFKEIKA